MKKLIPIAVVLVIASYNGLAQYALHDGSIDTTYGVNGSVIFSDYSAATGITILSNDESVLLVPRMDTLLTGKTGLLKLKKSGEVDSSFGVNGVAILNKQYLNPFSIGSGIIHDGSDRIISIGTGYESSGAKIDTGFIISRNLPDGTPDSSFNKTGYTIIGFGDTGTMAFYISMQADGKYIIAGENLTISDGNKVKLVRINIDGSVDSSFGTSGTGRLILSVDASYFEAFSIQQDGKFLIASENGSSKASLKRFKTNGYIDFSFGYFGDAVAGQELDLAAIKILPDGSILAAGIGGDANGTFDFILEKYTSNGLLDKSFGTNGITYTDIDSNEDFAEFLSVQADNKIVLAGQSGTWGSFGQAIVRYNENGMPDSTFGINGATTQNLLCSVCSNNMYGMGLQSNGDLVTAGYIDDGVYNLFASRYVAHPYKLAIPAINNAGSSISVYPNPATGIISVSIPNLNSCAIITIYNIMGKALFTAHHNFNASSTTPIDMSTMAAGVYFVKVVSETGCAQVVKLVKE
ncbi:MAG: T9SS type A sorting domain-containing protein [Flavipsychrobacter sp.]|nr:T9SS type A sorting domain-containing protein [Flavipsychrobacter sp.]